MKDLHNKLMNHLDNNFHHNYIKKIRLKDALKAIYSLIIERCGPLAQWIERGATDSEVEGSSPSGPAKLFLLVFFL